MQNPEAQPPTPADQPTPPGHRVIVNITGAANIGEALTMVNRAMNLYYTVLHAAQPPSGPQPPYRWWTNTTE